MSNLRLNVLLISVVLILLNVGIFPMTSSDNYSAKGLTKSLSQDSPNDSYLFYIAGHHGKMWSKIVVDSAGFHISNGTTKDWIDMDSIHPFDTLSFLKDNAKNIEWGFDSLLPESEQLKVVIDDTYNPLFYELSLVINGKIAFSNNPNKNYVGSNSDMFNQKLDALMYLMQWIAYPSLRQFMPVPNDSLQTWTKLE